MRRGEEGGYILFRLVGRYLPNFPLTPIVRQSIENYPPLHNPRAVIPERRASFSVICLGLGGGARGKWFFNIPDYRVESREGEIEDGEGMLITT